MKKVISLALALMLAFTVAGTQVFAEDVENVDVISVDAANEDVAIATVNLLNNLDDIRILADELLKIDIPSGRSILLSEIAKLKKSLSDISVDTIVGDKYVDYSLYDNVRPIIKDGTTLVCVRAITECLGAEVLWDEDTRTVTVKKGDVTIELVIGSLSAKVNGEEKTLLLAPEIIDGRTVLPIRFIAEAFDLIVNWDNDSRTVLIDENTVNETEASLEEDVTELVVLPADDDKAE